MAVIVLSFVILVVSLAGGLVPRTFAHRMSNRQLEDLTGLSSGMLLASALLVVVPEGFHTAASVAHDADEPFAFEPVVLGATVLLGFVAMLLLEGFGVGHAVHEEHHDHVDGHGHGHIHHPTSPRVLAIGLSAHALADGLAIGAASTTGDTTVSVLVAAGVLVHRIPAALSLGLFALHDRDGSTGGFRGLVLFATATPVALLVSYLLLDDAESRIVALALLFSAGTFLYVATVDSLPAIHNPANGRRAVRNVVLGAGGFTAFLLLLQAAGFLEHSH